MKMNSFYLTVLIFFVVLTGVKFTIIYQDPAQINFNNERFNPVLTDTLPHYWCEHFLNPFPPNGWSIMYTGTLYWQGLNGGIVYHNYLAPMGTTQSLITPEFIPTAPGDSLKFDVAYQPFGTAPDSLIITGSTDGGTTYPFSIARLSYFQLGTTTGNPSPFVPTLSQWARRKYSFPAGINMLQFKAKSGFGDNLYLDSFCTRPPVWPAGIEQNGNNIPENYSLSQNYPNPFNPSTIISFGIPKAGNVKLFVFDVAGREVKKLINEYKNAGNYTIEFDAADLPTGVYFYKLETKDFSETRKMILVK